MCLQSVAVSFAASLWGNSSILSQHGGVCYTQKYTYFYFIAVLLCHLSFLFFNVFTSLVMFQSLFPVIDPFVCQAQECFKTGNPSFSLSVRPDGFVMGCRGRCWSCWLAACMAMIERECLKSWHFTSVRDKNSG